MSLDDPKIKIVSAKVVSNEYVADNTYALEVKECFLDKVLPGQFVAIEPVNAQSCMIRPFSVFGYDSHHGWLAILYKVVGKNTELLVNLKRDEQIKIWGPLGKGLNPEDFAHKRAFLVAGGMGIAPLDHFNSVAENYFCSSTLFYGAKTESELCLEKLFPDDYADIICATEDGTYDWKGTVTQIFEKHLLAIKSESAFKDLVVLTCGPKAMMKKISEICQKNRRECFVFLETIMACGIGACLGCSIKMKSGEMKRVCHDGPVFNAEEVDWNAFS